MRYAMLRVDGGTHLARAHAEGWQLATDPRAAMADVIEASPISFASTLVPAEAADFAVPLAPRTIHGIGLNYRDTVKDMGWATPKLPYLFPKLVSSVIGPEDHIVIDPEVTSRADWEGELAVIIGRECRNVPAKTAHEVIFGYTAANDISARDLQENDGQWVRGKGLDTFCPLGPAVVTTDEIADPEDLRIRTWVGDDLVQDGTTADMIFSIAQLIEYLSTWFTLSPGDVILTGTPAGCGDFREPRRSLVPGDRVRVEVESVGELDNLVVGPSTSE